MHVAQTSTIELIIFFKWRRSACECRAVNAEQSKRLLLDMNILSGYSYFVCESLCIFLCHVFVALFIFSIICVFIQTSNNSTTYLTVAHAVHQSTVNSINWINRHFFALDYLLFPILLEYLQYVLMFCSSEYMHRPFYFWVHSQEFVPLFHHFFSCCNFTKSVFFFVWLNSCRHVWPVTDPEIAFGMSTAAMSRLHFQRKKQTILNNRKR